MSTAAKRAFENLARDATKCRKCFTCGEVSAPDIDVAQPRWVGPRYWESSCRVAILMINPGRSPRGSANARSFLVQIRAFRDGAPTLRTILDGQREAMESWAHGQFRGFYIDGLGLDFEDIAFANVAWCATANNSYPRTMLDRCFELHTGPLLRILRPTVVLTSGSGAHHFGEKVCAILPEATVIKIMHYAHREGRAAGQRELTRVRSELTTARSECGRAG